MRAPDPTLAGPTLFADADGYVTKVPDDYEYAAVVHPDQGPAIACVSTPCHFNGVHSMRHWTVMPLRDVMYFAAPCAQCFPDAPPPGMTPVDEFGRGPVLDPDLSWQVGL